MNKNDAPWLLLSHGNKRTSKQSLYDVSENHHQLHATISVPTLRGQCILTCAHGWLVLYKYLAMDDNCCLWDPVSTELIKLPSMDIIFIAGQCVLSKPPTEPDSHILFVSYECTELAFCRIGDKEFIRQSIDETSLRATLVFQGKIYGITGEFQIVTIDFVRGDDSNDKLELTWVSTIPVPRPAVSQPWLTSYNGYLMESPCGRELLLVHRIYHGGSEFRVFRVDIDRMELQELESIGNRVIFLPVRCSSGVCRYASGDMKPNSIYYTRHIDIHLYVYDLDDQSTTLLSPSPRNPVKSYPFEWFWVDRHIFKKFCLN